MACPIDFVSLAFQTGSQGHQRLLESRQLKDLWLHSILLRSVLECHNAQHNTLYLLLWLGTRVHTCNSMNEIATDFPRLTRLSTELNMQQSPVALNGVDGIENDCSLL